MRSERGVREIGRLLDPSRRELASRAANPDLDVDRVSRLESRYHAAGGSGRGHMEHHGPPSRRSGLHFGPPRPRR
jgi:hypothetical protein